MSAATVLRNLLQSEPDQYQLAQLGGVNRVHLVWSPHLLSYSTRFNSPDTLWVFRKLDPQLMRRDPLTRAEVLGPVTALADGTRLRILELLTEKGELHAGNHSAVGEQPRQCLTPACQTVGRCGLCQRTPGGWSQQGLRL